MPNGRHSMAQRTTHRSIRNTRWRRAFRILPGSLSSTAMAACAAQGALATSRWAKGPRSMASTAWVRRGQPCRPLRLQVACLLAAGVHAHSLPKRHPRRCAAGVAHAALHQARGGLIDAVPGRNRKRHATADSRLDLPSSRRPAYARISTGILTPSFQSNHMRSRAY